MDQVRHFFSYLVTQGLVNINDIAAERNGVWTLTKPIADLSAGATFHDRGDMLNRITAAVLQKYQASGGLKVAS